MLKERLTNSGASRLIARVQMKASVKTEAQVMTKKMVLKISYRVKAV